MDKWFKARGHKLWLPLVALLAASFAGGCASRSSYPTVPVASAGSVQSVNSGTVVSTKTVVIDGQSSNTGRIAGAAVGGGIGATVGNGTDARIIGSAIGTAAGVVVGPMIEKELTKKVAQEITIDMDDGQVVVIVQERVEPGFIEGDRVEVMETRTGVARVRHAEFASDGLYWMPEDGADA